MDAEIPVIDLTTFRDGSWFLPCGKRPKAPAFCIFQGMACRSR
jgi:hypothetical protein